MQDGVARPTSVPETASGTGSITVDLVVEGMHCPSCAALIEETLTGDPDVRTTTVDLEGARATVTYDPTTLTVDDLCAAVNGLGYRATSPPPGNPGS